MKKSICIIKRIIVFLLCFMIIFGLIPITASAARTNVPGAQGYVLTDMLTGTFTDGYDSTIFLYATPGAAASMQYEINDYYGYFQIPDYDKDEWYFYGWRTWYTGSHSGAGVITSDKANPQYNDDLNYFEISEKGWVSGGKRWLPNTMQVYKETLWDGTYYLSAIFYPIVTINAPEGVKYERPNAISVSEGKFAVNYDSSLRLNFTAEDNYVITGINILYAAYDATYSKTEGSVKLNNVTRSPRINVSARLKRQFVIFDANDGSSETKSQIYSYGESEKLEKNDFSREKYIFTGWNTEADGSGTAISDEQTLTFTPENDEERQVLYAQWQKMPEAQVDSAPKAKDLSYNSSAQELVTAGVTSNGVIKYSLEENGTYTENIPSATEAGSYNVWYYVEGDSNHFDSIKKSVAAEIKKAEPSYKAPTAVNGLLYNGTEQELINAAETNDGAAEYALGDSNAPKTNWSSEIPKALSAREYHIWYRIKGDKNHKDTAPSYIVSKIDYLSNLDEAYSINEYEYFDGNKYWFKESNSVSVKAGEGYKLSASIDGVYEDSLSFSQDADKKFYIKRESDGAITDAFDIEDKIGFDNTPPVSDIEDGKTYIGDTVFSASDELTGIKEIKLDGEKIELTDGKFTISADDKEHIVSLIDNVGNEVQYKLKVETFKEDKPLEPPKTGDSSKPWAWVILLLASAIGIIAALIYIKKRKAE